MSIYKCLTWGVHLTYQQRMDIIAMHAKAHMARPCNLTLVPR